MKASERLVFGEVVYQQKGLRTMVMVVEPTIGRNDFGGGWFTGYALHIETSNPMLRKSLYEIGAYQRAYCGKTGK